MPAVILIYLHTHLPTYLYIYLVISLFSCQLACLHVRAARAHAGQQRINVT